MDRLRFGHERLTDSDCCLICTCLSVKKFENAINKSYTHVQPHCIFFFFQCRTRVVSDCFKFRGTRHVRHTQLLSPRLCTTKNFTMTQLKLQCIYMGTWAYWLAWLTCCWRLTGLNSSVELAPTVVSGRWFHSRTVLWKKEFLRVS